MTTTDHRYLTLSDVSELTGEDGRTLMHWMDEGKFPTPEVIPPDDIDEDDDTSFWLRTRVEEWMRDR
jgi:predicted DNA-binding transcriptional regulator AlpA